MSATINIVDQIRKCVSYNPENGVLTRDGRLLGCVEPTGYIRFTFKGKCYRGHQAAWAIYYGEWPCGFIDHINGDKTDNRIANLRIASPSLNAFNQTRKRLPSSGYRGVYFHKATGLWHARIRSNYKVKSLGYFSSIAEAVAARKAGEIKYFGENTRDAA